MSGDPSAVATEIRADLAHALVAVDFDGTLAPIVPDPADSRPAPGACGLRSAGWSSGARRWRSSPVVTPAPSWTSAAWKRYLGCECPGSTAPRSGRTGTWTCPTSHRSWQSCGLASPGVLADAGADPGVWIEDKRLSLVVHARKAADPAAALARLTGPVTALAAELGLEVHPGRDVLEIRLPGYDKGSALRRLIAETSPRRLAFIGDDVGDLPAFDVVAQLRASGMPAWSIAVRSDEAPAVAAAADLVVTGPEQVVELLAAIAR